MVEVKFIRRYFHLKGPQDEQVDETEEKPLETTTQNEAKVKVGQIFTDEEYDSLKKVENKNEENEGINWGFGKNDNCVIICFIPLP